MILGMFGSSKAQTTGDIFKWVLRKTMKRFSVFP